MIHFLETNFESIKDPNISVEASKKAVTYSPTMWQYHLR